MKIILSGFDGKMGSEISDCILKKNSDFELVAGVDEKGESYGGTVCYKTFSEIAEKADVLMDFSNRSFTEEVLNFAKVHSLPLVMGTTGQTEEEKNLIKSAAEEIPLFYATDFSPGIALFKMLLKKAVEFMPAAQVEMFEIHHKFKKDAPSGTAKELQKTVDNIRKNTLHKNFDGETKVHSLRLGNSPGIHGVLIDNEGETLTLKHEAHSRSVYADGALFAARFLYGKAPGLYGMDDIFTVNREDII